MSAALVFGHLGAFWLCLLIIALLVAFFSRRKARAAIIFRHLGIIVQQNLPLAPALLTAAASETGRTKQILLRLARRTTMGIPLSQALATGYARAPAVALSVVQAGERSGTLPDALRELNERMSRQGEPAMSDMARRWMLYTFILLAFTSVYVSVGILVMPNLLNFFGGLAADESPATIAIEDIAVAGNPLGPLPRTVLGCVFRALLVGLLIITPVFLVYGLARLRAGSTDHVSAVSLFRDFAQWRLWPTRKLTWASCCARALSTLRLTLAAGWPLSDAVERASEIDANYFARRRLRHWAARLRSGEDAIASGRSLHLPEMLLAQLAVGIRDGDLDAPLQLAEDYYRYLEIRWKTFFLQLLWPLTTIYLGAIAGILATALFLALKGMIDCAVSRLG
jgi:type II secretory pathway component PulF